MTELSTLKEQVCNSIDKNRDMLLSISHEIHSNPELAFEEFKASKLLSDESEKVGMKVVREAYGLETAYASDFGNDGPRVAILSEYDALPGIGHSCGHNIIATTGFGAAAALLEVKDSSDKFINKIKKNQINYSFEKIKDINKVSNTKNTQGI